MPRQRKKPAGSIETTLSLPIRLQFGVRRLQEKRMAQGLGMPSLNELYLEGVEALLLKEGIDLSQIDTEIAHWSAERVRVKLIRSKSGSSGQPDGA